ncbi:MobF family relaxase [Conexibacter sp. DBS9H8]|uniref:MobF family relaxase n=1 Tax=Conexibacter sp. DBS9H8 TaxID=2937801 RepID=UPI00200E622F|nr:MobF family relaxase [Conexibacter sp. DBS9H8]
MLILAKISTSAGGGYADYLEGKTRESELGDYYLKDGERVEAPGRWAQGAEVFGLDPARPVSAEQLHTLMEVRRPDTGAPLRPAGAGGTAVAAIDATFSAPKSVSAVWALAGTELRGEIELAHERAVDAALGYATRQVPMLRRRVGVDTVVHEKAGGVIATSWRHSTARAVEDQVPDPQLHSHVLLHGAVRRDGRVVAIDSRSWLVHQREVGAAYRSVLAQELHRLGFAVERGTGRGGRYFEIAGVPRPLLDRWSSRHHQVQTAIRARLADQARDLQAVIDAGGPEAADAAGQLASLIESGLSPKQERLMGTITRSHKLPVTAEDLDTAWRRDGARHGFGRERIDVLRRGHHDDLAPASPQEVLDALTEFDATFPARDARAVALERSAGTPIDEALRALVTLREQDQILVLADGTGTTRAQRGKERTVVAIVEQLTHDRVTPLPTGLADTEVDRLDTELAQVGGRLSDEQRAAIRLGCADRPFVVIEGQAGTGKSTTLIGIARAHQAAGRDILITSTAGLAAERLGSDLSHAGVTCQTYSTSALSAAITHGRVRLGPESTIIHDEAALASTDEQAAVLDAVAHTGARLIAVGDPHQNQPVGAGGLWETIETAARESDAHVELTINQRAQDPMDQRDQAHFRQGRAERALRGYAARDHIHFNADRRRAEDDALLAAHRDRADGLHTLVVVQTSNEHLDQLNARAQAIRIQAGELGNERLPVPGRPYALRAGDEVQVRHTLKGNDTRPVLRNGTGAEVTTIDSEHGVVELRLASGDTVTLSRQEVEDADLRLAYVQHPFPAQGQTVDTTHLIVADHSTQEGTYVALTRARQRTDLYAPEPLEIEPGRDRLQQLAEHLSRSEPEIPSIAIPLAHEHHVERAEAAARDLEPTLADAEEQRVLPHVGDRTWATPPNDVHETAEPAVTLEEPVEPRRWPTAAGRDPTPRAAETGLEREEEPGWEI